ncbi:membrane protein of unknown function [Candidatus Filomicrobium marinum]|uniref:Uncharacterized protein n=2 Tax=Filomicrobium TaxID=119044 RepID=A0A0D6JKW1_9HYPH|nr:MULTISPECIES: hypothetical protein [Filomicrobium]CFX58562.1 membrane protein of unknown function [Candidatus Filomicrobium marinum]CPR22332.1 membrane protein of unknown function [Candidatus Filomicrobium marinum]SDO88182.1 hypothetical protein SAMN04488061_1905 [Filomicrobium insigne]
MNTGLLLLSIGLLLWTFFHTFRKSAENRMAWGTVALLLTTALGLLYLGNRFVAIDEDGILREFGPSLPVGATLLILGILGSAALSIRLAYRRLVSCRQ